MSIRAEKPRRSRMAADDRQSRQARRIRKPRQPGERATAWIAMLVDAWSELRVNRLRILLALVGVMVAVIGLTGALGAGSILKDTLIETGERQSGRTATVSVSLSPSDSVTPQQQFELLRSLPTDYGVSDWSLVSAQTGTVLTPQNRHSVSVTGVDPAYQQIYRVPVVQGQFLTAQDADRLAPAVVVNEKLWERLGSPNLTANPGVTFLVDHHEQTAVFAAATARPPEESSLACCWSRWSPPL